MGDRWRALFSLPNHTTHIEHPISACCGGPMSVEVEPPRIFMGPKSSVELTGPTITTKAEPSERC